MKNMPDNHVMEQARNLYKRWEADFRAGDHDILTERLHGPTMEMVRRVVALFLVRPQADTLDQVEDFLAWQRHRTEPRYRLVFRKGQCHFALITLPGLEGFQFGDLWLVDGFQQIDVAYTGWGLWKPERMGAVVMAIFLNMVPDGLADCVGLYHGRTDRSWSDPITVQCCGNHKRGDLSWHRSIQECLARLTAD
jgi:hypothetical protein